MTQQHQVEFKPTDIAEGIVYITMRLGMMYQYLLGRCVLINYVDRRHARKLCHSM